MKKKRKQIPDFMWSKLGFYLKIQSFVHIDRDIYLRVIKTINKGSVRSRIFLEIKGYQYEET